MLLEFFPWKSDSCCSQSFDPLFIGLSQGFHLDLALPMMCISPVLCCFHDLLDCSSTQHGHGQAGASSMIPPSFDWICFYQRSADQYRIMTPLRAAISDELWFCFGIFVFGLSVSRIPLLADSQLPITMTQASSPKPWTSLYSKKCLSLSPYPSVDELICSSFDFLFALLLLSFGPNRFLINRSPFSRFSTISHFLSLLI